MKFWTSAEITELEERHDKAMALIMTLQSHAHASERVYKELTERTVRLEEGVSELLEGIATFVTQANDINAQLIRRIEVLEKRADTPKLWRP